MGTFKIEIKETLSRIIELNASDEDDAINIVRKMYKDEDVILDETDYVDTDFINLKD